MNFVKVQIPALLSSQVTFITDWEFNISENFPKSKQLYCWNHLQKNIEEWLICHQLPKETKCEYVSNFFRLIKQRSEIEYNLLKKDLTKDWDIEFTVYFEKHIEADILKHAGRWVI